jgi:membrane protein YdbS with pleckstrin-like domain
MVSASPGGGSEQPTSPGRVPALEPAGAGAGADWPEANWLRPSPRLRLMRRGELIVAAVPVLIAAVAVGAAASGAVAAAVAGVAVMAVAAVVDVFLRRRVGAWRYAERDDDLLVRRGLMFRRLSIIPYGRMQFVDVTAGPVERSLGLATVRMHTAAAASDARIPGLTAAEAARLRDNLTTLGEARAAGL